MDAFISHASEQVATAKRLRRALERNGLHVWMDDAKIRAGILLRDQLSAAIQEAKAFVLLWSKAAARSRWVSAELLTAFHVDRPIIPCSFDTAPLPQFMSNLLRVDVPGKNRQWISSVTRAVRDAPPRAFVPIVMTSQEPRLKDVANALAEAQQIVLAGFARRDLATAQEAQDTVGRMLAPARRRWRYDAQLLNIAGYHSKNAYMLKHWEQIQAGFTPADALLNRAEKQFFQSLFVDPNDFSALNGLASVLILEHELRAAAFFNGRAIQLAEMAGVDYDAAKRDRTLIEYYLQRSERPTRS